MTWKGRDVKKERLAGEFCYFFLALSPPITRVYIRGGPVTKTKVTQRLQIGFVPLLLKFFGNFFQAFRVALFTNSEFFSNTC